MRIQIDADPIIQIILSLGLAVWMLAAAAHSVLQIYQWVLERRAAPLRARKAEEASGRFEEFRAKVDKDMARVKGGG